jgi:hypothetical protein
MQQHSRQPGSPFIKAWHQLTCQEREEEEEAIEGPLADYGCIWLALM